MKKGLSELVFILDRSGSMNGIWNDAKGALSQFIKDQQAVPGEANFTLVVFDHEYDILKNGEPIQSVNSDDVLNGVEPRGWTALLDAIGRTVSTVGERLSKMSEEERPEHVIFGIMTDGMENKSKEYTRDRIKEMITLQQETYSWQFMFMGANQDSFLTANSMGIDPVGVMNFCADSKGTQNSYHAYSVRTTMCRSGVSNVNLSDIAKQDNN